MDPALAYREWKPGPGLSDFVDSCWMLHNTSDSAKEVVVLPDGRIDLILSQSAADPFHITLMGLDTAASRAEIAPGTKMFAVSFQLLAVEYVLHMSAAQLLNSALLLPDDFWHFQAADLDDFDAWCQKVAAKVVSSIKMPVDERKRNLFALLRAAKGSISIQALSEQVFWSSRQINRYFQQQYGLPLKTYSNILRFRASFTQLREGRLFPEADFADQAHFIREIRKFSGTIPSALHRNENDRFIQFSVLPPE
jgi:AraC-like DNA-binding protein